MPVVWVLAAIRCLTNRAEGRRSYKVSLDIVIAAVNFIAGVDRGSK
jgi:hypothetical protein